MTPASRPELFQRSPALAQTCGDNQLAVAQGVWLRGEVSPRLPTGGSAPGARTAPVSPGCYDGGMEGGGGVLWWLVRLLGIALRCGGLLFGGNFGQSARRLGREEVKLGHYARSSGCYALSLA